MSQAERGRPEAGALVPERHAVVITEDGQAAYRALIEQSARWRAYVQSLPGAAPRAPWLVQDLFCALYQPELRLNPAVAADFHRNFAALAGLVPLAGFARLRKETTGDPLAAAMAARRLADELLAAEAEDVGGRHRGRSMTNPLAGLLPRLLGRGPFSALLRRARTEAPSAPGAGVESGRTAAAVTGLGGVEPRAPTSAEATDSSGPGGPAPAGSVFRAVDRAVEGALQDRHIRRVWGIEPGVRSVHKLDDVWALVDAVRRLPGFEQLTGAFADMTELLQPAGKGRGRRQRRRQQERRYEKLLGLTRGRDLERVVPEEMVRLFDDDMAGLFHEAYEHRRLLQERYGAKPAESPGPLVVCLDVSRSMNTVAAAGRERFAWAKGVGLALLDAARRSQRPFVGICFSSESELETFAMAAGDWRPQLAIDLARCDFDGGTHFQAPLMKAVEHMERDGRGTAPGGAGGRSGGAAPGRSRGPGRGSARGPGHIVFVTDGEAALPAAFVEGFEQARRRLGFRLFTVFIDGSQPELVALSDRTFVVEGGRFQSWEQTAVGLARALAPPG